MAQHINPDAARQLPQPSYGYGKEEHPYGAGWQKDPAKEQMLERFRRRLSDCAAHWDPMYKEYEDDWLFYGGNIIGAANREAREKEGKPVIEINFLQRFIRHLRADETFNNFRIEAQPRNIPGENLRPSRGPTPEEMFANPDRSAQYRPAQIYEGILNGILGDPAVRHDGQDIVMQSVVGGFGVWQAFVDNESSKTILERGKKHSWDRRPVVRRVPNPCDVYLDPNCRSPMFEDAAFGIVFSYISKAEAIKQFGEAARGMDGSVAGTSYNQGGYQARWMDSKSGLHRIATYYERERVDEKTYLLAAPDGREFEMSPEEFAIAGKEFRDMGGRFLGEGVVQKDVVKSWVISGDKVLRGPDVLPFQRIPLVPELGDHYEEDGRKFYFGLIRPMKGAQKGIALSDCTAAQIMSKGAESPIVYAYASLQDFIDEWQEYVESNGMAVPYQHKDEDDDPVPPPFRMPAPELPQSYAYYADRLKGSLYDIAGMPPVSLGEGKGGKTPESARAILAKQQAASLLTNVFLRNHVAALESLCGLLVPSFSSIYNRKRMLKIITQEGKYDWVQINDDRLIRDMDSPEGRVVTMNSLRKDPMLDIKVSVDQENQTDEMEYNTAMMEMLKGDKDTAPLFLQYMAEASPSRGSRKLARALALSATPPHLQDREQLVERLQAWNRGLWFEKQKKIL